MAGSKRCVGFAVFLVGCAPSHEEVPDGPSSTQTGAVEDDDGEGDDGFCENIGFHYGPAGLPSGRIGEPYRVDLHEFGEPSWRGVGYSLDDDAPPGLTITHDESTPMLEGVPEEEGFFAFDASAYFEISDDGCENMPDTHAFTVFIEPADETTGTSGSDGSSGSSDTGSDSTTGSDETTSSDTAGTS